MRNILPFVMSTVTLATVTLATVAIPAHAGLLVGTTLPTGNLNAELDVDSTQFLAQSFTLTSPAQVTSIGVLMSGFGTDPFTLWVTNAMGPGAIPANVLLQTDLVFPNTGGGVAGAATVSATTDLFLAPGSYFLIESSTQVFAGHQGWIATPAAVIPTQFGSVGGASGTGGFGDITNSAFPPGSTFSPSTSFSPLAFQISGNALPEPRSLFYAAMGLAAMLVLSHEGGFLRILRPAALIAALAGAAGSVGLTLYAGRHNNSRILVALFVVWVLAPFMALLLAHGVSKQWPDPMRVTLYSLTVILTLCSLAIYGNVALGHFGGKTAFPFLAVPLASWLLIGIVVPICRRLSRRGV